MNRQFGRCIIVSLGIAGWLAGATLAPAQTISGSIAGTVYDPKGAVVAGVAVTATNVETGLRYVAASDARGYYRIAEVPPGNYTVLAEYSGFQPQQKQGVRVDVDRVTVEDFSMNLAPPPTLVEVKSSAPVVVTDSATLSTDFTEHQIRQLPVLTRDVNNLALLAPGVESVQTFSFASTLVPFAVNGSRGRDNNFIIDSVNNNEPLFGGAATQFTNTDIFQEYTILTGEPKAEFGRNSGATVNVITKSGSSQLHGTVFWFGQSDRFNAENRVEQEALLNGPAPFYENQIGGTLGGPLKAKKDAFFFISYQWDRARNDLSNVYPVVSTLPTVGGLATLRSIPNPTAALQSLLASPSVQTIPAASASCFAGTQTSLALPVPNSQNPCFTTAQAGAAAESFAEYGTFLVPHGNLFDVRDHQASGRIDARLNDSNDLYGRYLFDDLLTPRSVLAPAGEIAFSDLGRLPDGHDVLEQRTQSFLLDERYARSTSLNEIRFSFNRIAQGIGNFTLPPAIRESRPAATVVDAFGGFGAFQNNFPSAGIQFTLGNDTRPTEVHSNIFEAQDNFSLTRGRNSLKWGADAVRTESNISDVPFDLGHYFFGNPELALESPGTGLTCFVNEGRVPCLAGSAAGSSNALAVFQRFPNLRTDRQGNVIGQGSEELPLRELSQAYFFQDDVRARPGFTLSLGVRYENFGQPINGIHRLNPAGPMVAPNNLNFAPRFGLAWAPGKRARTVLRGGYALLYNDMPLNIPLLIWQSAPLSPLVSSITGTGSVFTNTPLLAVSPSGQFPAAPLALADVNTRRTVHDCSGLGQLQPGSVPLLNCSRQDTVAADLKSPYVQNFSFGLQQALSANVMFEIDFVGSQGRKLYQRVDLNPYTGWNEGCLLASGKSPNCLNLRARADRGDVTAVTNQGLSSYNALQASFMTRAIHSRAGNVNLTAAYTWSHMIDNASEIFGPGVTYIQPNIIASIFSGNPLGDVEAVTPFPQNSADLAAERGNSSFDRRHRLAVSYVWELPTLSGRAANFFFGGWQWAGVTSVQSGQPFTPLNGVPNGSCADANGDGLLTNDRPSIGNPKAPPNAVALLADPACINPSLGYLDLTGQPIDPASARFVQVPVGVAAGTPFTAGNRTFIAGDVGRNTLIGPWIADFDLALYKEFRLGEISRLQFRWEVYDLLNHPNPGFAIGNVFASNVQPTPGFAFSPRASAAGITGVIPENAIDATDRFVNNQPHRDFLSQQFMNTSNRHMQFGVHLTF
jgi:hypothetical protein